MNGDHGARQALAAVLGGFALSLALTRPAPDAGIHDSDSALFVVEAAALDQTSVVDPSPEWNTLVRIAAQPWGGIHLVLLRTGQVLSGEPGGSCGFRAIGLYWFWAAIGATGVALAGCLGYLLAGPPGAFWVAGLSSLSLSHFRLYSQFNQVGTAALLSLCLLVAGAWRARHRQGRGSALMLGVAAFLLPFSDNMWICTALAFPVFLWMLTERPRPKEFAGIVMPFVAGTGLASIILIALTLLRAVTGRTVYACTLLHFVSRVITQVSRAGAPTGSGGNRLGLIELLSLLGTGMTILVVVAVAWAIVRLRSLRDFALVSVALAHAVPLLFVSKGVTLVSEYFQHAIQLIVLVTGVLLARCWATVTPGRYGVWSVRALRVAAVLPLVLILSAAREAGRDIRRSESGEAWAILGARLSSLPHGAVIASTVEQEVGILYSGRRILTLNDTAADTLQARFEEWPGRMDALVVRASEQDLFRSLAARRGLEPTETAGTSGNAWVLYRKSEGRSGDSDSGPADACRRQPYMPYYLDAGWRYPPDSLLRKWGPAALVSGDPQLWSAWSRATGLPPERFMDDDGSGGEAPGRKNPGDRP